MSCFLLPPPIHLIKKSTSDKSNIYLQMHKSRLKSLFDELHSTCGADLIVRELAISVSETREDKWSSIKYWKKANTVILKWRRKTEKASELQLSHFDFVIVNELSFLRKAWAQTEETSIEETEHLRQWFKNARSFAEARRDKLLRQRTHISGGKKTWEKILLRARRQKPCQPQGPERVTRNHKHQAALGTLQLVSSYLEELLHPRAVFNKNKNHLIPVTGNFWFLHVHC